MGVPQPKPTYGHLPNFQDLLTQEDPELISFCDVSSNNCCNGNTIWGFQTLWVFHSLNQCMDFQQICKISLHQEKLGLIRFFGGTDIWKQLFPWLYF